MFCHWKNRHLVSHCLRGAGIGWLLASLALAASADPATTGGAVPVYYADSVKRIGVSVASNTPEMAQLMQRAFAIHGAFDIAAAGGAQYILRFESAGANRVVATIEPKTAGGISGRVEGAGASWREAAYRAGDAVVEKLTQRPGFFAGKLAFVRQGARTREIFMSDVLGQEITQLTFDRSISILPRWSPDGTKLLYTGYYRTGFPDIVLVNLATKQRRPFANYQGTNTGGTFSPDGKQVAMILSSTGNPELWVCNADGAGIRRLTRTPTLKASPTWSPDGTQIALDCDPRGSPLLYEIPAAGGTLKALPTNISNYCAEPSWNPRDADVLAFMEQQGSAYQIATLNLKTSEVKTYVEGSEPCWTNDGRHLIFTRRQAGQDQLCILDTATGKAETLTTRGAAQASFVYVK